MWVIVRMDRKWKEWGTHSVAADGGDDGLAERGELAPVLEELALVHFIVCMHVRYMRI